MYMSRALHVYVVLQSIDWGPAAATVNGLGIAGQQAYMKTIECLKSTDAFQQYKVILPANNAIWGQSLPRMEQYFS